jgi:hypothetical protein
VVLEDTIELSLKGFPEEVDRTATLDWRRKSATAGKGPITKLSQASHDSRARDALLAAIGKARGWIEEITQGASFAAIGAREGKSARYVRKLVPLAFVPPDMVRNLIDETLRPPSIEALAPRVPLVWPRAANF